MPFMDGFEATTVIGWLAMVAEARSTTLLERAPGDPAARLAALEIFDRLGARPDLERLRQRLRAEGVRHIPRGPRPTTRGNPFGLTAREVEIALLLARALTNAGIGRRALELGLAPTHARPDGEVATPK
jgi:hypothetical protein